ncbi:hypothetical protein B0H14DRAFT_3457514 [Mycena olivaceomarginata]|nr:hypothetical protein B0H14DRAFT_3457514 [Mycena olivaceomarginata]
MSVCVVCNDVQTTQTDSNAAKTMGALEVLKYMLLCKVILNLPEDVHTLVSIKFALKYTQLQEAPRNYKDKLSSELTIRLHLTALYNTLLESPSLHPTLLSPLSPL